MSGFRKHGRTHVRCAIRLTHTDLGDVVAETHDVSETGVFIKCRDLLHCISVGDEFEAKMYSDGGVSSAQLTVVRMTREGIGLAYA